MPWKETNVMDEKERFIQEMLAAEKPFKHLCAEFYLLFPFIYPHYNSFSRKMVA